MIPIIFPEANGALGAPEGHEDSVGNLPVHLGAGVVVSAWKPDEDELKRIADGGVIYLTCWGQTHAPLFISARHEDVFAPIPTELVEAPDET